jgi:hypothetical protein
MTPVGRGARSMSRQRLYKRRPTWPDSPRRSSRSDLPGPARTGQPPSPANLDQHQPSRRDACGIASSLSYKLTLGLCERRPGAAASHRLAISNHSRLRLDELAIQSVLLPILAQNLRKHTACFGGPSKSRWFTLGLPATRRYALTCRKRAFQTYVLAHMDKCLIVLIGRWRYSGMGDF